MAPKYRVKNFNETDINNIINLYELGYTIQDIKDVTKISSNIIKRYLVMKYDNKIPITQDEISYFKRAYKAGKSLTEISQLTGRTTSVIRNYIRDLITIKEKSEEEEKINKILKQKAERNSADILDIYLNSVYEISDIAKYYEVPNDLIKSVLKDWVLIHMPYNRLFDIPIDITKIKIFRDFYCSKGDKYKIDIIDPLGDIKSIEITIKEMYPKVIMTDKGSFTYKDLLLKAKSIYRNIKND